MPPTDEFSHHVLQLPPLPDADAEVEPAAELPPTVEEDPDCDDMVRLARAGVAPVQFLLGCYCGEGRRDRRAAAYWLYRATDSGTLSAIGVAADLWLNPKCSPFCMVTEADRAEAHRLYGIARRRMAWPARRGDAELIARMGEMYRLGQGGPRNQRRAALWFRYGIRKSGCVTCQARLGRLFFEEKMAPRSKAEYAECVAALQKHGDLAPEAHDDLSSLPFEQLLAEDGQASSAATVPSVPAPRRRRRHTRAGHRGRC